MQWKQQYKKRSTWQKNNSKVSQDGKTKQSPQTMQFILFTLFINFDSKLAAIRVSDNMNCEYITDERTENKKKNTKNKNELFQI